MNTWNNVHGNCTGLWEMHRAEGCKDQLSMSVSRSLQPVVPPASSSCKHFLSFLLLRGVISQVFSKWGQKTFGPITCSAQCTTAFGGHFLVIQPRCLYLVYQS